MKKYKAIFFDWDGTAVVSRRAPVDDVIQPIKELLQQGVALIIISGTTYDNIASGKLAEFFTPKELKNLFLGLGRGAYNYRYDEKGHPFVFQSSVPKKEELLQIHDVCYELHRSLLDEYNLQTDIVFSRPGYCKIDLMVGSDRGEQLFLQENELQVLKDHLTGHNFTGGLQKLMGLCSEIGKQKGLKLKVTSDAKYLEVGTANKSDNVDQILWMLQEERGIVSSDCTFWGDEYVCLDTDIYGSDSYMLTETSKNGDFFDVSDTQGRRPNGVTILKGGVNTFLKFLCRQVEQTE